MGRPRVVDGVADRIAEAIAKGDYRVGQWLPARTLSDDLGVSRGTVMRALEILDKRGIVTYFEDKGARVATRYTIIARVSYETTVDEERWRGLPPAVSRVGDEPYADITGNAEVPAPREAAELLGVPVGTTVFERARLQGAIQDGERLPVQLATSWYPLDVVEAVPEIATMPELDPPPIRRRMLELGRSIHPESELTARLATEQERDLLRLPELAVVVVVWRVWKDEEGVPIEAIRIVDDARWVEIRY